MARYRSGPEGFRRVTATVEELAEWRRKHSRSPSVNRMECLRCGKRIWGSGLAVGSHRRSNCSLTPDPGGSR